MNYLTDLNKVVNKTVNDARYYYMYAYENIYGIPSANEILDGVFIGDIVAGNDLEFLKKNKIKYVINISNIIYKENQAIIKKNGILIRNVPIRDIQEDHDLLLELIPDIIASIKENRKHGKILVNCFAGKQRSAAVVACYLYKYVFVGDNNILEDKTFPELLDKIITFIQHKRSIAFTPIPNFYNMILTYIKQVNDIKI